MRELAFIVLVGLGLSLCPLPRAEAADDKEAAKASYEQGVRNYNLGKYQQAREAFEQGYLAKPDPVFLFNIGQCARQLGDFEGAVRQYRAYLRERPGAPNRVEVQKFIVAAEDELKRRQKAGLAPYPGSKSDSRSSKGPAILDEPPTQAAAPTQAPPPSVAPPPPPPPAEPKPLLKKWWFWTAVGGGALVLAGAGVGIAFAVPNHAGIPSTSLGSTNLSF